MKKLNLPNKLTVARLFMVPVFLLVMFFIPGRLWIVRNVVGAMIFLGASITDAVDGHGEKIRTYHGFRKIPRSARG